MRDVNDPKEFVEIVRLQHFAVATSENVDIAASWGTIYKHSQRLFKAAIQLAYPNLDTERIYDLWIDNNESVAYCANWVIDNPDD